MSGGRGCGGACTGRRKDSGGGAGGACVSVVRGVVDGATRVDETATGVWMTVAVNGAPTGTSDARQQRSVPYPSGTGQDEGASTLARRGQQYGRRHPRAFLHPRLCGDDTRDVEDPVRQRFGAVKGMGEVRKHPGSGSGGRSPRAAATLTRRRASAPVAPLSLTGRGVKKRHNRRPTKARFLSLLRFPSPYEGEAPSPLWEPAGVRVAAP